MDHVVPSAIFEFRAENPVKVPACNRCNNDEKSRLDSYLRDRLLIDSMARRHPTAQRLFNEEFARAVSGNRSPLTREFLSTGRAADIFINDEYKGQYETFAANWIDIESEVTFIAKGLSFAMHGSPVPADYGFRIVHVPQYSTADVLHNVVAAGGGRLFRKLGPRDEFISLHGMVEGGERSESWTLVFYGAVAYLVSIHDPFTLEYLKVAAPVPVPRDILSDVRPVARPIA
jgi:hypothetical protein